MFFVATQAVSAATILVMGDSLSAGYGIAREKAWPALLEARLKKKGAAYSVINASISGETTEGGRSRLPQLLKEHHPAIVLIALGANDGLRGFSSDLVKKNLLTMVVAAQETGAKVLLIGMKVPPNYGEGYAERFEKAFVSIAKKRDVPLVPFLLAGFADKREMFQSDGLHPTEAAQPLILETVWSGLAPLLK